MTRKPERLKILIFTVKISKKITRLFLQKQDFLIRFLSQ
jgi:hypothetical protein